MSEYELVWGIVGVLGYRAIGVVGAYSGYSELQISSIHVFGKVPFEIAAAQHFASAPAARSFQVPLNL